MQRASACHFACRLAKWQGVDRLRDAVRNRFGAIRNHFARRLDGRQGGGMAGAMEAVVLRAGLGASRVPRCVADGRPPFSFWV